MRTFYASLLIALPGSQAPLGRNGQILLGILAPLSGLFGGDQVSLQVRVWDNMGGTIGNWSEVIQHPEVARGVSRILGDYQLAGVGRDGTANVGSGSIQALRGPITLSEVCPEPAGWLLLGVASGLAFLGRNRCVIQRRLSVGGVCKRG